MTTFLQILMCLFAFIMNEPCPKLPVDDTDLAAVLIEVPVLNQYPALPTGCEATAATMVLQYFHEDIDHVTFASEWLNCEPVYDMEGLLYGPHPQQAFVGDPFSEYGLGCYAGAIEQAQIDDIIHGVTRPVCSGHVAKRLIRGGNRDHQSGT